MLLKTNYSMLTDFYEFTMSNGYLEQGVGDTEIGRASCRERV